jgi:anti-anti-sigma factor
MLAEQLLQFRPSVPKGIHLDRAQAKCVQLGSGRSHAGTAGLSDFVCDYEIESSSDTLWVSPRGRLAFETRASTERCWEAVRRGFKPSVVLDLSQVMRLDSTALGSLVGLRRWLHSRGSCLRISATSPEVRRVVTATRLDRFFAIADEPRDTSPSPEGNFAMRTILQAILALALVVGMSGVGLAGQITLDAIQNGDISYTYYISPPSFGEGSYSNVTADTITASSTYVSSSAQNYSDAGFLFQLSSLPPGATITQATLTVTVTGTTGSYATYTSYGFPDTTGNLQNDASSAATFPTTDLLSVATGANSFDLTSYFTSNPGASSATYVGVGLTGYYYGSDYYSATFDSLSAASGFPTLTLEYTTASVSEPASVTMLVVGLAILGLLARQRRGASKA